MYVLGISGSPTDGSNTDRLVQAMMSSTGAERQEFVKLSDIQVGPCRAHLKCTETNRCDIEDDFQELSRKVLRADALVLGTPTFYNGPTSFMRAFIERCYSLRHQRLLLKGKLCAIIAVGTSTEQAVADWMGKVMAAEGLEVVGSLAVKGSMCCMSCGHGKDCAYTIWNTYSKEMTGVDRGIKEAYLPYVEVLPGNIPYQKGSAEIKASYRDATKERPVMQRIDSIGKMMTTKHDERSKGLVRIG